MQIKIKSLSGKIFDLEVEPGETILDIKRKMVDIVGTPIPKQRFVYAGKECINDQRVDSYMTEEAAKTSHFYLLIKLEKDINPPPDAEPKPKKSGTEQENKPPIPTSNSNSPLSGFIKLLFLFALLSTVFLIAGGLIGGLFGVWPDINAFFEAIHLLTDWGIGVAAAAGGLALGITNMVGWKAYGDVSLNPFAGIIETDASPNARTLRTGFWGKVEDARIVFFGNKAIFSFAVGQDHWAPEHFGLLDAATLYLSGSLEKLMNAALSSESLPAKIFGGVLFLVWLPFLITRLILTALLVFNPISLFIIGVVHVVSEHLAGGAELKKIVFDKVQALANEDLQKNPSDSVYSDPRDDYKNYQAEDMQLAIDRLDISPSRNNQLSLAQKVWFRSSADPSTHMTSYTPSIFAPDSSEIENQKTFEKALLTLNCGDITRELEKSVNELPQKQLLTLMSNN